MHKTGVGFGLSGDASARDEGRGSDATWDIVCYRLTAYICTYTCDMLGGRNT